MRNLLLTITAAAIVLAGCAPAEKSSADLLTDDSAILLREGENPPSTISLCQGPESDGAQYRVYRRNADGEFVQVRIIFCPHQR